MAPVRDYKEVNGLKMYYEIHGTGKPLVLIHGGGSTIETSFARLIPLLGDSRQLIAVELQAHGHTGDRDQPLSFQQDADDIAQLLKELKIPRADILGFSNGGQTALEIALRHPGIVNKMILCSMFYKREGVFPGFWEGFRNEVSFSNMPQGYKDAFLKIRNDQDALMNMFNRDVQRMKTFSGWTDEQIHSITVPVLVVNGNEDVGTPEHAVEMYRRFPNAKLIILPGGHGDYLGELASARTESELPALTARLFSAFLDND